MSLFNLLCGRTPYAGALLYLLGIHMGTGERPLSRIRDVVANNEGTEISVTTRWGGKYRERYKEDREKIKKHPLFLRDYELEEDKTYLVLVFSVPPESRERAREIADNTDNRSVTEKFTEMMNAVRDPNNITNRVIAARAWQDKIGETIKKVLTQVDQGSKEIVDYVTNEKGDGVMVVYTGQHQVDGSRILVVLDIDFDETIDINGSTVLITNRGQLVPGIPEIPPFPSWSEMNSDSKRK